MNIHSAEGRAASRTRNGGEILVSSLRRQGVDTIFGVPGESALPIFDALYDEKAGVRFVVCRHEANAAHMAEADGKLRGAPGVCLVSRGPGAMHAAVGVHTARQDSTPMVLLIGQVPREQRGREAFQEIEYTRMFADMAKWAAEIDAPERIPEYVARAFHLATEGRPGPVVLSLPEDVLSAISDVADATPVRALHPGPSREAMQQLRTLVQAAKRPLAIVGNSGGWTAEAAAKVSRFLRENDIPVMAGFRSQDIVDNRAEQYVGDLSLGANPALGPRVKGADLLLVIGDRLGDVTTKGYSLLSVPDPTQTLIHVFPGAEELGRVYTPALPILSSMGPFADALAELEPVDAGAWKDWRAEAREVYLACQSQPTRVSGFDIAKAMIHLRDRLPEDAIVTNGAGNYTIWLHRFYRYCTFGSQLAPKSGSMGYGLPAAIAAKLRFPERKVVAMAGDGCFMMSSPDFATAVRYGLAMVVIIVNNATYGSIRMHQERHFPGRPSGTDLVNPDFAGLARSYGAFGEVVERDEDFAPAFERALAANGPAIIELRVDPNRLTPDFVLS